MNVLAAGLALSLAQGHVAAAPRRPAPAIVAGPAAPSSAPREAPPLWSASPRMVGLASGLGFGLGAVLLGVMTSGLVKRAEAIARLEVRAARLRPGEPLDPRFAEEVRHDLGRARSERGLAIASGVAATVALGSTVALLVLYSRRGRGRVALAPWWLASGAGLTVRLRLR